MRDALSLMDQVISYGSKEITGELVQTIFGILPVETYIEMLDNIQKRDSTGLLVRLRQILDSGKRLAGIPQRLPRHPAQPPAAQGRSRSPRATR